MYILINRFRSAQYCIVQGLKSYFFYFLHKVIVELNTSLSVLKKVFNVLFVWQLREAGSPLLVYRNVCSWLYIQFCLTRLCPWYKCIGDGIVVRLPIYFVRVDVIDTYTIHVLTNYKPWNCEESTARNDRHGYSDIRYIE